MAKKGPAKADSIEIGAIDTICGGDHFKDGQEATKTWLESPQGIEVDDKGNLYFSDKPKGRVYVRRPDGNLNSFAGTGVTEFSGDGGSATSARFHQVYGMALHPSGDFYLMDCGNRRIRKVDSKGMVNTVVGTGGTEPLPISVFEKRGQPALEVPLADPYALLVDPSGRVWFSDSGAGRIYTYDPKSKLVNLVKARESGGVFNPMGLALIDGMLYIADRVHQRVVRLEIESGELSSWLGGPADRPRIKFSAPHGLGYDGKKYLYLTDPGAGKVFQIDVSAKSASVFVGNSGVTMRDRALRSEVKLHTPSFVRVAKDGTVYVSESSGTHRAIVAFYPDGKSETIAGRSLRPTDETNIGDGGPAKDAILFYPRGLAADKDGNLFISDSNHRRVRKINANSGNIETVVGRGWSRGQLEAPNIEARANLGAGPRDCCLFSPRGLAFDAQGNLLIVDVNYQTVLRVSRSFDRIEWIVRDKRMRLPMSVAIGKGGELYVDDRGAHVVWKVDPQGCSSVFAGTEGASGCEGDGGLAIRAKLHIPSGVAVGPEGEVYVGEEGNHRVRMIRDGKICTFAGTGKKGHGCPDGDAKSADLHRTRLLGTDPNGNIYVVDNIRRILKIDRKTERLTLVAGGSRFGYSGDGGPAIAAAQMTEPHAVAFIGKDMYIADNANQAIRRVRMG